MSAQPKPCSEYARRRPELTPCYQIVQEELSTFIAERALEDRPLPTYVVQEFEAYLKCGILAHGFLRFQCVDCKAEHIVAFSCKKRGFCPSCCAKRMAEAAAHLVENVLPLVSYRQFVLSFPIPLRYWLHTNRKLFSRVHRYVIDEIHGLYQTKATRHGIKDAVAGTISFNQRFGSSLNLNPHLHILCLDGVYSRVNDKARFHNVSRLTDDEVADLVEGVAKRILGYLKKKGYLDKDGEIVVNPACDSLFQDNSSLLDATTSSISGKIAFGPNAGKHVTRIGSGFGYLEEVALAKGRLCYSVNGFSLHANTHINPHQRDRLAKLIEYIARGPLSNERLELTADRKVKLRLKTPWSDGTTHLLLSYGEFMEKLTALIPPPRSHLVRWAGVFAPHSPFRKEITLKPENKKGFQFDAESQKSVRKNHSWSKMLARVFKIDVTHCPSCGGPLLPICKVTDGDSIRRYLEHIGVDYRPPPRAPPRMVQGDWDFDQTPEGYEEPVIERD
jgi:hypothetical protein